MIVAVDGPAAAGKGTLARRIAEHYRLDHLDTGRLYRATAFEALHAGGDPADAETAEAAAKRVRVDYLGDPRLNEERVARASSVVAAFPGVRAALLAFQRDFARRPSGAVLDGRDIGTVVLPDARPKFWVTASPEARGLRRWLELRARGAEADLTEVTAEVRARDARDAARLIAAIDAVVLDTTALDAEATFRMSLGYL